MSNIKLMTDSDCDLSEDLVKKYDVEVISLYINFGDVAYRDGVDIKTEEMYKMIDKEGKLPKTAAASPGDFEVIFQKLLAQGKKVFYIGVSSKLSATLNNAKIAKDMIGSDDIYIVDSFSISSGMSLLVLKAAQYISQGNNIQSVYDKVTILTSKVRCQFAIDTLEYLYKGGRLSALKNLLGSVLKVKPIIKVTEGVLGLGKKGRGNIKFALDIMIKDVIAEKEMIDLEMLFITHSLAHDSYLYIMQQLKPEISFKNIYEAETGCGISCHSGRGTVGIIYLLK